MKKLSSLVMASAFLVAIGGAVGTKATASPKFLNRLQGFANQTCTPVISNCGNTGIACSQNNIFEDNASHTCLVRLTKQP
jgi:hypothetical protein